MICEKCGKEFPTRIKINGERKNLSNRSYCLECSPWGLHNTRKIERISISQQYELDGTKFCPCCKKYRKMEIFSVNKQGRVSSYCKICCSEHQMRRWKETRIKAVEYKGNKCLVCGYDKCIDALEFHHRNPEEKRYDWQKLKMLKWATIQEELDKCDMYCSNCHREIHTEINRINKEKDIDDLMQEE